jgi:hypothetical protein
MRYKTITAICILSVCVLLGCQTPPNSDLNPAIEEKIDTLLSKMTLEEKAGQMSQVSESGQDGPADIRLCLWPFRKGRNSKPPHTSRIHRIIVTISNQGVLT